MVEAAELNFNIKAKRFSLFKTKIYINQNIKISSYKVKRYKNVALYGKSDFGEIRINDTILTIGISVKDWLRQDVSKRRGKKRLEML